jgi:hypothetical protein
MMHLPILALVAPAALGGPSAVEDAFVYGTPLLIMDATRQQMTSHTPENRFYHLDRVAGPAERVVVRLNTDTLYSSAWIDLSRGPVILHVPESQGRYYLVQLLDAWTNVIAAPGTRTIGSGSYSFALVGPGFQGQIPAGTVPIPAPTKMVWAIGRTAIQGPDDLLAARAFQQQITLSPMAGAEEPAAPPPPESATPQPTPPETVAAMEGVTFLRTLAKLMGEYPPPLRDHAMIAELQSIGLMPGAPFSPTPELAETLDAARQRADARIVSAIQHLGQEMNGWRVVLHGIGRYGTDYDTRAAVAVAGLGANLPEDAVYPVAFVDGDGQPLSGAHHYVLHFAPGRLPPARAFWSLTMYDEAGYLVPNAISRYAIHDRDPLVRNADGSLDIVIQHDAPAADHASNWLPAPENAPFNVTLRIYWPEPRVLAGLWQPPPIQRIPAL